jgi:hypothetical protein
VKYLQEVEAIDCVMGASNNDEGHESKSIGETSVDEWACEVVAIAGCVG